ncbi:MAG: acetyl-CoA carboxylase biotin carboxylase subunit [Pseudomonadota bacterium]|nr:acetyl-CoA carboxylase biotin carboxylase subunit [Pseudomonadota bacterium]
MTPFAKLLVANRGEIAVRVLRSARAAGLRTVAVYSEADAGAPHVALADESVCIGKAAPRDSYLSVERILEAARATQADAIHPGYGFLSENDGFAEACAKAGLVFVGPSARAIRAMGNKAAAKTLMIEAGVPCVPGYQGDEQDAEALQARADAIGYPLMIKAAAGGGGRGMRLVERAEDFAAALKSAKSETKSAFGDETVLLERAILNARHIEIQILADRYGHAIHLGERDCSVQRRHQKLIEEAPSPAVSAELRERMGAAAVRAAQAIRYEGAGTLEFLLGADGAFYFMEMNTRLQVEHPVTEAITGLDLVALQLDIAAGKPLAIKQEDVAFSGHAIEVRLCAEDPANGFMPQSGTLSLWAPSPALRVEHGLRSGVEISPFYDSMIAKLIAHGANREAARAKLMHGLGETLALGLRTNQDFLTDCLANPVFAAGAATTAFIGDNAAALFPDRARQEKAAAMRVAALLSAAPDVGVTHGFPRPVRLKRGETFYTLRVYAGPRGATRVEAADEETQLVVARADGGYQLTQDGRSRKAVIVRHGAQVWLRDEGRSWDFEDVSFEPTVKVEAERDGKVRAAMNGRVASLDVAVGDRVTRGQKLLVLEAMKMEHVHVANVEGIIATIHVAEGDQVDAHRIVVEVAPA